MLPKHSNEHSHRFPWPPPSPVSASSSFQFHRCFPTPFNEAVAGDDRATITSKSHSLAEKRRRDRINTQLATLRNFIPDSDKMDKAALLGSAIDHVKDLKRKAMEVSKAFTLIPTELDEVTIDSNFGEDASTSSNNNNSSSSTKEEEKKKIVLIRASVCCEDRPELFRELKQVLQTLRLSTVRADIASVGGRTKSILVVRAKESGESENEICVNRLMQSLKLYLNRIATTSTVSNCQIRSKRQRFFLPSQSQKH